ncbi:protein of unknown function [Georgfuchsia toluolica]|uniref:Uncharacterized protein n=1 Tax=Georgfuchsia toluolica TaxID=424218 RepID=A0A916MZJ7_9PROT|nr:protein of unknown function [Georgfuchsia toluolica]
MHRPLCPARPQASRKRLCSRPRSVGAGMNNDNWLEALRGLLVRFSHLGIGADVAAMTVCELWGLYCYLRRLAEG